MPQASTLQQSLLQMRKADRSLTLHQMAKGAGVSTTTMTAVINGEFGPGEKERGGEVPVTGKKVQGWTESLARIVLYANSATTEGSDCLELDAVLREYGMYDVVSKGNETFHTVISEAVSRTQLRHAESRPESDPVLKRIAERENKVNVGYLRWPPFIQDQEELASSWAHDFTSRLLLSINPIEWKIEPRTVKTFDEAIACTADDANSCDIVFGLYDTPFRRLHGLDFVSLPGTGVSIGALVTKRNTTWEDIFKLKTNNRTGTIAVVIQKEVGHLFLKGACGYTDNQLNVVNNTNTKILVNSFAAQYLANEDNNVVFVADSFTCRRVYNEIRRITLVEVADNSSRIPEQFLEAVEILDGNKNENYKFPLPVYRVGWGFRNDAPRWKQLLLDSLKEELFRNSLAWTAHKYMELFSQPGKVGFSPLALEESGISKSSEKLFVDTLKHLQEQADSTSSEDELSTHIKYWRRFEPQYLKGNSE